MISKGIFIELCGGYRPDTTPSSTSMPASNTLYRPMSVVELIHESAFK